MSDIFISYARSSAAQAHKVAEALRALGYGVWRDDELPAHRAYSEVIEERLKAAKAVVVIWSAEAVKSEWVQSEADQGRTAHKLVQLTVDGSKPPMPFDRIQCADLVGWKGDPAAEGWRKVIESIRELVGGAVNAKSGPVAQKPSPQFGWLAMGKAPWLAAGVGAAVLALIAGLWLQHASVPPSSVRPMRLAVIPFEANAADPAMVAFAASLSDKLIDSLTASQMSLTSRADATTLGGPDRNAAVARLGVDYTLEGDVTSDGKTLTVGLHLDDAKAHATLWSRQVQRPLSQADQLQTDVTTLVTRQMRGLADPALAKSSVATVAAFLAAGDTLDPAGDAHDEAAITAFRKVVAQAPDLAPAHSALAWALVFSLPGRPADEQGPTRAEAEREANLALQLEPDDSEAYGVLAQLQPPSAFAAREDLLLKGLSVGVTQPEDRDNYLLLLTQVGRMDDAVANARLLIAEEPDADYAWLGLATTLLQAGRFDELDAALDHAVNLWPDNTYFKVIRLQAAAQRPDVERTERALAQEGEIAATGGPANADWVRLVTRAAASKDPGLEAAAARATRARSGSIPAFIAFPALAALGDVDGAFAIANVYFKSDDADPSYLFGPLTRSMRQDKRFMPLAARIGLVTYWRSTGHWPDFCATPGLPYDCKTEAAKLAGAHS